MSRSYRSNYYTACSDKQFKRIHNRKFRRKTKDVNKEVPNKHEISEIYESSKDGSFYIPLCGDLRFYRK